MCAWFFFLQAEDGIRDGHVTGVQTCALPIWVYQIPNYSTTVKEFSGTYVSQSSGNIFQQASYGSPWNMYNDDLITISEMLRLTEGDPYYANLHAMGRIWSARLLQQGTDHYGESPYFGARKSQDEAVPDPPDDPQEA